MDWFVNLFHPPQNVGGFLLLIFVIRRIVSFIGVVIILWGAGSAIGQFFSRGKDAHRNGDLIDLIRLRFGRTIILGLEFIVAADVIETTTAPDYYTVGILASLVGIRTLLTFFMNREMVALGKKK